MADAIGFRKPPQPRFEVITSHCVLALQGRGFMSTAARLNAQIDAGVMIRQEVSRAVRAPEQVVLHDPERFSWNAHRLDTVLQEAFSDQPEGVGSSFAASAGEIELSPFASG